MHKVMLNLLLALRFRQWIKNLLLIGAPLGAAVQPSPENLIIFSKGFFCFCLISSAGYVLNDWIDRINDRSHEKKKWRPFANQELNGIHASMLISVSIFFSLLLSIGLPELFKIWLLMYGLITTSYSLKLKNIPVIELLLITLGFVIRGLAGAALFQVNVSQWFIIVASFGSLFLIGAKRLAEFKNYKNNDTRSVITRYSEQFLTTVISMSITITLMAYVLWALEVVAESIWGRLSIVPVMVGVLRYLWISESEDAEAPERAIFSDKFVPISASIAAILLIMAIYR